MVGLVRRTGMLVRTFWPGFPCSPCWTSKWRIQIVIHLETNYSLIHVPYNLECEFETEKSTDSKRVVGHLNKNVPYHSQSFVLHILIVLEPFYFKAQSTSILVVVCHHLCTLVTCYQILITLPTTDIRWAHSCNILNLNQLVRKDKTRNNLSLKWCLYLNLFTEFEKLNRIFRPSEFYDRPEIYQ